MESLIKKIKNAATKDDANHLIKSFLKSWVEDVVENNVPIPDYEEDECLLFEDESVSIWHCRYRPGFTVPAHDHQIVATIAVYQGIESNTLWVKTNDGGLKKKSVIEIKRGEVLQFGPTAIHSVSCANDKDSLAVHVYQGNLSTIDRSLFDTQTGQTMPFSDENYELLANKA